VSDVEPVLHWTYLNNSNDDLWRLDLKNLKNVYGKILNYIFIYYIIIY